MKKSKKKKTLVTVVIPTYNRAKFLPRAIKSILKQTTKKWKLLIIDDGSTDKTKKVVKRYLSDSRIRYVRIKKNRGVSNALKKALSMVDTKYFTQLDADDWYEKHTIKSCLKKIEMASKKVAMVYGNEKVWKLSRSGKIRYKGVKKKRQMKGKYDFITYHPMVYPRFYRKSALKRVGGWSTKVPYGGRYAEDRQILLKLAGHYKFRWINKPLYNRLRHPKNNSRVSNNKKYAKVTSHLYRSALRRWGNKFTPIFKWKGRRLKVGGLKRR